jgi:hypothetical protein
MKGRAMGGGRQRTNPVDAALVRLADLAGRGVTPARMAREVDVVLAGWGSMQDTVDSEEVAERLSVLREHLAEGVADAAEQLADIDRGDGAALRHAGLVHAALVGALEAVGPAHVAQGAADRLSHAPNASPGVAAPAAAAAPESSASVPAGSAVTIDPLAERNPQGLHHHHTDEVRAGGEPIVVSAKIEVALPIKKERKPRRSPPNKEKACTRRHANQVLII